MADNTAFLADVRRYASLLEHAMPSSVSFAPEVEDATTVQVERGLVLPLCMSDPSAGGAEPLVGRLIELTAFGQPTRVAVVDRFGHDRPAYRPLLVYAWLQAFRIAYETLPRADFGRWEEGLRAWCDDLETRLDASHLTAGGIPASRGASVAEAAWVALALHVAGKVFIRDAWTDLAGDVFGRLVRGQQPSGALLALGPSDNPEPAWYHELVILHAAASYAVQAEDRHVAAAVARATSYHQNETQPDHATTQPWAVFAFVWNADTRPLADQLLHAQTVQHPQGATGLPLMLLADALYCLRLFL